MFDGSGISNNHGDLRVGRDVNIITNHGGHSQPIDTRSTLLESLRFDQIDARRQTINNAHSNTCRWFLQTEQYKQWDDRGSTLQNRFLPGHEWTVESLRSVLEEAAQDLEDTSIICTIDALDECDQGQIRDMVSFFETLAHNHRSLQICFASRHYPHINIRTGLSIILEEREGHREDITTYLSSALTIGHSKRAEKIRSTLQEKARGVFMWVILVVEILNKDYDAGDVLELEERIKQLPEDLHALFRDILTRDTKNRQALLLCIQWILYAKDPLTPTQLYLAILSGSDQKSLSKWNSHDHEEADARRYILDKSKGLVEVTKAKIPTVQFIHESVNDFLLKEKGLARLSSDDVGPNVQGSSHEALKLCCLTYIDSEAVSKYKECCKTDVVKFLLGCGCPIPRTYSDGQTPLHYASSGGCIELAKLLLDYGSEIMATNDHGKTPLHLASAADVAELLILRGSNIEATSGAGGTPLHDASRAGRVAVAQVLVDSGACVSAHNRFTGSTPLHTAAQHGSTSMMRFLIDNGASVLSTDKDGDTPLHDVWLSKKSAAAALDLLLKKGMDQIFWQAF
ncbi:hypothetical protein KJ359_006288 [Pestalotiopsis sp. 9143b]|nr:hypothetical protein KJ359_006288 [Pestalotiopsis sp. 9143b]